MCVHGMPIFETCRLSAENAGDWSVVLQTNCAEKAGPWVDEHPVCGGLCFRRVQEVVERDFSGGAGDDWSPLLLQDRVE